MLLNLLKSVADLSQGSLNNNIHLHHLYNVIADITSIEPLQFSRCYVNSLCTLSDDIFLLSKFHYYLIGEEIEAQID